MSALALAAGLSAASAAHLVTGWVLTALGAHRPRVGTGFARAGRASVRRLWPGDGARSAALIGVAGLEGRLAPRDVAVARFGAVVVAALTAPTIAGPLPTRVTPVAAGLWLLAGSALPEVWLRRRARLRQEALQQSLPNAFELLSTGLAAGLSLRGALVLAAAHSTRPASDELHRVVSDLAFGATLTTAFEGLAVRGRLSEIDVLVATIARAVADGSPPAPVVAAQAADLRAALNRSVIERGARAGPKIQIAIAATFVPAALLAGGAVVIAAIAGGDLFVL